MPRKHVLVKGRVQGVGFRWFVRETAERLGVAGWVRNLPGGEVEAEAEAAPETLAEFERALRAGHGWARVEKVESRDLPEKGERGFEIRGG